MFFRIRRRWLHVLLVNLALLTGVAMVALGVVVPVVLLSEADDTRLHRWSEIGQAVAPVGVFYSGVAFVAIALTLFLQGRELRNQREELAIAREEQMRSSEIALRELHTDLIRMAIEDPELRQVWPEIAAGVTVTKRDHYCNLILNLQKVAYETHTIELAELRGALQHLMASRDMYGFWAKARMARVAITGGDEAEDFFTTEVDRAFAAAAPPAKRNLLHRCRVHLRSKLRRRSFRHGR
ncbi:hypothetical protein Sru01_07110 [Sphaerisporangium rufum]|uniref:Uncharacterized protein n=1 Tax=Sphaerisporangium rufum TaxID=1381558 RepID=A0A919QX37_9ACTN|nr:DUF6082 family protein [Sphaerisporangium rufum]GII75729.1 hypothetical protein Sru01_07110 [Sphaerisporangium rufum]